ncbi:MAG: fructose-bisphosphatase class II family protein [Candidatus Thorarchaeota archaeon]|jgi:fructose-1,6-bisphosphatase II
MRKISLDLIRVTEAASIAASKWIGSGNKEEADRAATEAMRDRLNKMDFAGKIVIGEGEKDESYGLFSGEKVGKLTEGCREKLTYRNILKCKLFTGTPYDIAVDPIEGTTPTVTSGPEAISTLAVAHKDSMYPMKGFYMRKMAYGPQIASKTKLFIDHPIERTIERIRLATGKQNNEITVCILNRPRHNDIISELRELGVRIKLIQDCDVSGAVGACLPNSGIDLLYGIGGSPEAVLSAAAIKCLGGDFFSKEVEQGTWEDVGPILSLEDLVKSPCIFVATGITNGSILRGVRYTKRGAVTHSVFMRSESGTVRWLKSEHGN